MLRLLPPLALLDAVGATGLLLPFLRYSAALWTRTGLDRRTRELVILRVAATEGCDYQLAQHVPLARRAGLSESAIAAALRCPRPYPADHTKPLGDEQRRALETADAVCAARRPLREGPEDPLDVAVALLAAHYLGIARLCRLLDLPPEAPASAFARVRHALAGSSATASPARRSLAPVAAAHSCRALGRRPRGAAYRLPRHIRPGE